MHSWLYFLLFFFHCLQVLSGDSVIIREQPRNGPPPEKQICLSNITAPKLARRALPSAENSVPTKDEASNGTGKNYLHRALIVLISEHWYNMSELWHIFHPVFYFICFFLILTPVLFWWIYLYASTLLKWCWKHKNNAAYLQNIFLSL